MKIKLVYLLLTSTSILASCANPIVDHTFHKYQRLGADASNAGDFQATEEYDRRALINTRIGYLGKEKEAQALHNLALAKHDLCKLEEAEDLLNQAIALRNDLNKEGKLTNEQKNYLNGSYFELAALYYAQGKFKESVTGYEKSYDTLMKKPTDTDNRKYMLSSYLNEYAIALEKSQRLEESKSLRTEEKRILNGLSPKYISVANMLRHPTCKQ